MRRDDFTMALDLGSELIIDNFAGGGGTSTGLEQAFGRPVDIAINHNAEALAMHAANHPHTKHLCESVWDVDPIKVTNNQPVGLVWLSPDCKHFSKAKGGKPVEKKIRGLAWVTLRWAAKCKPRVIMLENVEEFKTWGPLIVDADGNAKPDPAKKGKTFESFIRQLEGHGYTVDHRELRGCDHDTPTIRKRFFLVARRDGIPIQWPAPTHGAPGSIGVRTGKLKPYRTAAECIDWSLECPSIFTRKKPLAEATLRRIAKGIMRYVVDSANPFIVGQGGPIYSGKPKSVNDPFGTLTTENHRSVVVPSIVPVTHQGGDRSDSILEPFRTITGANRGEKALSTAFLSPYYSDKRPKDARGQSPDEPVKTVTTENRHALVSATLIDAAHGEVSPTGVKRWGQGVQDIETPLGTVVASGNKAMATAFLAKHYTGVVGSDLDDPLGTVTSSDHHSLVTALLTEHANASNQRVMPIDEPLRTICAQVKGGHFSMVSAHVTKFRSGAVGSGLDEPLHTVTAGGQQARPGTGNAMGIVTAHIESLYGQKGNEARAADMREPMKTVTASARHAVMTSNLVKLRGTSTASGTDEPLGTVSAGGQHHAEVRAFLLAYYGASETNNIDDPLNTVTSKDRFGLVTIHGQDYQIVDIGLRMLAPRELFRAQGFPDNYIIGDDPEQGLSLTKSAQVRMCGNSVCPPMAKALILANFKHEREIASAA
jgi:DNA (cytosine-5)-methyltransferase 1